MPAEKSDFAKTLDELQNRLRSTLRDHGFRSRGRTFNRTTSDKLTEVIQFQMGSYDPPGTTYIPGLRENLYGKFTVNLGIFVPEVAQHHGGGRPKSFVQEYHCCIRTRLAVIGPKRRDVWWDISGDPALADELVDRLAQDAFPFFRMFDTRDKILAEWLTVPRSPFAFSPTRIVCAIILTSRGQFDQARALLAAQAKEITSPGHPAYVRGLAERLGLGYLGG
jgi:hypothetical protein